MKLSKETISLLKNFAQINTNLYIDKGNVVRTVAPSKHILAKATLSDVFPKSFGIFDMSKFISAINLFQDAELDFTSDNYVTIENSTGSKLRYVFAEKESLILPPAEFSGGDKTISVKVTRETLEEVLKAASAISATTVSLMGRDGQVKIVARSVDPNMKGEESVLWGDYSVLIGETTRTFAFDFQIDNLKLYPSGYDISLDLTKKPKAFWKATDAAIEYWVAAASTSFYTP